MVAAGTESAAAPAACTLCISFKAEWRQPPEQAGSVHAERQRDVLVGGSASSITIQRWGGGRERGVGRLGHDDEQSQEEVETAAMVFFHSIAPGASITHVARGTVFSIMVRQVRAEHLLCVRKEKSWPEASPG